MWYVYILRCADGHFYVGETGNLASRLTLHNEGTASAFTASRRPVAMVYAESYATRDAARKRERQIKGWTRRKKEALLAGDAATLKRL